MMLPQSYRALILKQSPISDSDSQVYHDVDLVKMPLDGTLLPGEVLIKILAVAFNHRDLWIRKGMYPGISFDSILGADAVGIVVSSAQNGDSLLNKRVFLMPMRGWLSSPDGPESKFGILGGCKFPALGAFSEYLKVERNQVLEVPSHLEIHHAAAWPLAGLTAWRTVSVNAGLKKGDSAFITGIGGGVALLAMQICVAKGVNVYVSSSSDEKIQKAIEIGAKGGVNYKSDKWHDDLGKLLLKRGEILTAIIDSGGGELFKQVGHLLKPGGRLVCYGMTAMPKITFTMREVIKGQRLLGSSMGSQEDMKNATLFIEEHKIKPVVSVVLDDLDKFEEGFNLMKNNGQFGKIVMKVKHEEDDNNSRL